MLLMASLMGSEDLHREVGQTERNSGTWVRKRGRRKGRKKEQTRGKACEIFIMASCMLCWEEDALKRDCSALIT